MNYVVHHLETCWEPKLEGKDGNREGVESKNREKMLNKQECFQPQWETLPQPLQSAHKM